MNDVTVRELQLRHGVAPMGRTHRAYSPTDDRSEDAATGAFYLGRIGFFLNPSSTAAHYALTYARQLGIYDEVVERARTGRADGAVS